MRRILIAIAVIGLIVFVALQFIRPAISHPPVTADLVAPPEVKQILKNSCYDCHSNQTRWPWYSAVAPFSWWIHHEVEEGRRRLNFSSWTDYTSDPGTEDQKLDEVARLIASRAMPPWYYLAIHPQARLTSVERIAITRWIADEKSSHASSSPR